MTLAAVSYSTAVAAASSLVFALVIALSGLKRVVPRSRLLSSEFISNQPAEHFRRQWQRLGRRRSQSLLPLLFFIVSLAGLIIAEPVAPVVALPGWLQTAILVLAAAAMLAVATRGLLLTLQRRRLRSVIDARLTVGNVLQKIALNRNRTFHDVPTSFGRIDHVIAGLHGVYAVTVVARRPARQGHVERRGEHIVFSDNSSAVSIKNAQKLAARLAQEGGKVIGHAMHVRLIVAVPGWEVHAQTGDDVLLTNERHLNMLTGWKDQRDYLLDEDVTVLQSFLDERCAIRDRPLS